MENNIHCDKERAQINDKKDCDSLDITKKECDLVVSGHGEVVKDNHLPNAQGSGDEVDTTYLDNIKTTETKQRIEIEEYGYKIIQSGNIIEIYKYENKRYKIHKPDNLKDKEISIKQDTKNNDNCDQEYNRKLQTIYNTRRKLKRTINANVGQYKPYKDKFITLTFKEFLTREEVIQCFKLFNKRLRHHYPNYNYQYIAVIEKGTKSTKRLHMHCLFFGLPYIDIKIFQKIWQYGNVNMKALQNYGDVANYILKYIEKTLRDTTYIPKGKKFYITSMGLLKAQEIYLTNDQANTYLLNLPSHQIQYMMTQQNPFVGEFQYTKIKLLNDEQ